MTELSAARQRAPRSDAGQVRFTERDLQVFAFLLDMKAIYEPDLAVRLGRLDGRPPLSDSAMRSLVSRWQRGGAAESRKLIYSRPRMVSLTANGARLLGDEHYREVSEFAVYHQADVTRVRLALEQQGSVAHGPLVEWESERQIRQNVAERFEGKGRSIHVPDGVVIWEDGTRAAIEVERTVKSRPRLVTILTRLLGTATYGQVIYAVASDAVAGAVYRAAEVVKAQAAKQGRTNLNPLVVIDIPAGLDN